MAVGGSPWEADNGDKKFMELMLMIAEDHTKLPKIPDELSDNCKNFIL